ncbi:MAG: hypothetical protein PVH25_03460 [Burkholderiales bacterium]|jgi:hypothetical protein
MAIRYRKGAVLLSTGKITDDNCREKRKPKYDAGRIQQHTLMLLSHGGIRPALTTSSEPATEPEYLTQAQRQSRGKTRAQIIARRPIAVSPQCCCDALSLKNTRTMYRL